MTQPTQDPKDYRLEPGAMYDPATYTEPLTGQDIDDVVARLAKEVTVTMGGATINYGKPPFDEPPIITPATQDPKSDCHQAPMLSVMGMYQCTECQDICTPATKPLDEQIDEILNKNTSVIGLAQDFDDNGEPDLWQIDPTQRNNIVHAIKALIANAEKQARRDQIMLDFEICSQETELDEMDIIMLREQMLEELEQS